jgi:hypothetical protein
VLLTPELMEKSHVCHRKLVIWAEIIGLKISVINSFQLP